MNYSEFLKLIPEAFLVLALILVFIGDFCLNKSERKNSVLSKLTAAMLVVVGLMTSTCSPASAFGGLYVSSAAVNVMKMILAFGSLIVVIMAQPWVEKTERLAGEFYMLLISTLLGMFFMMSSGNFLLFFLGLETASVPLACMVAFDKWKKNSAEGAAKYILVATFSSGVMLYGISFIYAAAGTLYFDDVAAALGVIMDGKIVDMAHGGIPVMQSPALAIMGLVFFFSGLGFKISLVPFHFWTADTYQGAPTPVTGYLSVVSKGAATLTLAIILMKVLQPLVIYWEMLLYIVICLTITIGNLFAIRQKELKRFMAFSSISQAGYIMLAVVGNSETGIAALMYYVLIYVAANMAVFTVINVVEHRGKGNTLMSCYDGFYQTNPKLAFLMTLALFSLAGIPPFAGMFSKFFVFMAAAQEGSFAAYFVVFIALINTVVSLYYYLLIVKAMYIKPAEQPLPTFQSDPASKLALALCTLGVALFGICSCLYGWLNSMAVI